MTNGQFLEGLKLFEPYLDSKSSSISSERDMVYVALAGGGLRAPETIRRLGELGWSLDLEFDNGTQYKYWKGSL